MIPREDFCLLSGQQSLSEYRFNTKTALHLFCKICGIKTHYHPRSHPDFISINFRTVTTGSVAVEKTIDFDGQNWEDNITALRTEV